MDRSVWREQGMCERKKNPYLPYQGVNKYYLKFKNQEVTKYVLQKSQDNYQENQLKGLEVVASPKQERG